jgi:phage tail-like protein
MAKRSRPATRFALSIDGEAIGFVKSMSGGAIKGVVATHDMGPNNVVKKHLATVTHEPITVEVGMAMGKPLYDWIKSSFDRSFARRSGEIISADFEYKTQRAIVFDDALITECTFPALDAGSKEPAYMTVTFDPERLRHERRNGKKLSDKGGTKTKKWLPSNFRFKLADLPCDRVAKIDSFTLKQTVVKDRVGKSTKSTKSTKHPTKVEVPNLKVTFSAADAESWEDYFQSFVMDGKCADGDELVGQVHFLAPNHKTVLGRIDLLHVGIISLRPVNYKANKEQVAAMEAELYVEEMKLHFDVADA